MGSRSSGCSSLTVTLLLIFMWPIGLIVMWATRAYSKTARIAITLIFGVLLAFGAIALDNSPDDCSDTAQMMEEGMIRDSTEDFEQRTEDMAEQVQEHTRKLTESLEKQAESMEARAKRMAERLEERRREREANKPARKMVPVQRVEVILPEETEAPAQAAPAPKPAEIRERYTLIRIMEEEIRPMRPVEFETGSHTLRPSSHAILDEVAAAIQEHEITKLLIGGHTDDVGTEADNMRLSQRRADAVRLYLQDKGVTSNLMAIGFGKTRPVVNATTPETRAQNRRVEFQIMQRKIVVEKETGER